MEFYKGAFGYQDFMNMPFEEVALWTKRADEIIEERNREADKVARRGR